jgi:hypothetical protein
LLRQRDELELLEAIRTKQKTLQLRRRVEGKVRLELMSEWIDQQNEKIEEAEKELGSDVMSTIVEEMSRSNKSSTADNERKWQIFKVMSRKQRNRFANSKNLIDVTPQMDGYIILSLLQEKDGGRPIVMAEINARQIKYEFVPAPKKRVQDMTKAEKTKYNKGFDGLSITDLKKLLKQHKQQRLAVEEEKTVKADSIRNIKPLSAEMKQWMPQQWIIYKRKKGLLMDDEESA